MTEDTLNHPDRNQDAPYQQVLIDFDLSDPTEQVLDSTPADLASIPMEAVRTIFTDTATVTIHAHRDEGQQVANLLAARKDIIAMVLSHGRMHQEDGVMSFTINALTAAQFEDLKQKILEQKNNPQPPDHNRA